MRHNFNSFFNPNTDITKVNECHECKYSAIIDKNSSKIDVCDEILKLKDEINIINNEIMLICNKNTETKLRHCKSTLDNLKSFSEEIAELLKYYQDHRYYFAISNLEKVIYTIYVY